MSHEILYKLRNIMTIEEGLDDYYLGTGIGRKINWELGFFSLKFAGILELTNN